MAPRACFAVTFRGVKPNNGWFVELAIVLGLEGRVHAATSRRSCVGPEARAAERTAFASFRSFRGGYWRSLLLPSGCGSLFGHKTLLQAIR